MDSPVARETKHRRNINKRLQRKFFDKLREEKAKTSPEETIRRYTELTYQHGKIAIEAAIDYKEIANRWPAL